MKRIAISLFFMCLTLISLSQENNSAKKAETSKSVATTETDVWSILGKYSPGFSLANAALSYMDSRKKDKQLTEIKSLLEQVNLKLDHIIVELKSLGVHFENALAENSKQFIEDQLLVVILRYDQNVASYYKSDFRIMDSRVRWEELNGAAIFARYKGIVNYQAVGVAMAIEHDFMINCNYPPEEVRKNVFKSYLEYFTKTKMTYKRALDSLSQLSDPGKLITGPREYIIPNDNLEKVNEKFPHQRISFNLEYQNSTYTYVVSELKDTLLFLPTRRYSRQPNASIVQIDGIAIPRYLDRNLQNMSNPGIVMDLIAEYNNTSKTPKIASLTKTIEQLDKFIEKATIWSKKPNNDRPRYRKVE